ncbi:hypothetical protein KAI04_04895 [Candidatus Pacearchaeota archaeon]|nr:hypothetical protein [Candidatus Pacearchaeota archaeon]
MTDIIIYTTKEVLEHKKKDGIGKKGDYCYWTFKNKPQKLKRFDRIYFAIDKKIIGSFRIHDICGNRQGCSPPHYYSEEKNKSISQEESLDSRSDNIEIHFFSESWENIKPILTKPFQGFKYADKVIELK